MNNVFALAQNVSEGIETFSMTSRNYTNNDTYPVQHNCDVNFKKPEKTAILMLGVIINSLSLAMLVRVRRKTRTRISGLIILLASNDLVTCGTFLISVAVNSFTCDAFRTNFLCNFLGLISFASYMWSLNIVLVMSVERYLLFNKPFVHRRHCSRTILVIICIFGLTIDVMLGVLPLAGVGLPYLYYDQNRFCTVDFTTKRGGWAQKGVVLSISLNALLRALAIAILNIAVSVAMRRRTAKAVGHRNTSQDRAIAGAQAFSLLTKVIAVTNVLFTAPFCIRLIIDMTWGKDHLKHIEDKITSALLLITPIVNPILYVASNKMCRQCLWDAIRCKASDVWTSNDSNTSSSSKKSFLSRTGVKPVKVPTVSRLVTQVHAIANHRSPGEVDPDTYYLNEVCKVDKCDSTAL